MSHIANDRKTVSHRELKHPTRKCKTHIENGDEEKKTFILNSVSFLFIWIFINRG